MMPTCRREAMVANGGLQTRLRPRRSPSWGLGRAEPHRAGLCGGRPLSPGTYRLADDQVAGEGDASGEDGGRHGDVEAEVKQHVPALPRDENGAGRGTTGACQLLPGPERDIYSHWRRVREPQPALVPPPLLREDALTQPVPGRETERSC